MKKISNIIGVLSGVLSIIFACIVKGMGIGSYEMNLTYGGDAYTGMQNASAQAANNVQALADIVRTGLFAFLLVLGIALICFFSSRISDETSSAVKAGVVSAPEQVDVNDSSYVVATDEIKETVVKNENA